MANQKFCQDCSQSNRCQEIYQKLGNIQGPSVVVKVVFAFLLPLILFIAALVAFEQILTAIVAAGALQTGLSFLLALSVTLVYAWIAKVIDIQLNKRR